MAEQNTFHPDELASEQWRILPFHHTHEVSSLGRIRHAVTKGVKRYTLTDGYPRTCVWKNGKVNSFKIHRQVVIAFIGEIPKGMQVNHKDGNRTNNRVTNLEIVTPQENTIHYVHALGKGCNIPHGLAHHFSKVTPEKMAQIQEMIHAGIKQRLIAKLMDVSTSTIWKIYHGNHHLLRAQ